MKEWIIKHWKEFLFFIMTWGIGWYLFAIVICKIDPSFPYSICPEHWTILFTAIFMLLLPFVSKISLGNIIKVERELKQTKTELSDFKTTTQNQFQFLTNNLNLLSQNLSNNINIYNRAPDEEALEDANRNLEKPNNKEEMDKVEKELDFQIGDEEELWIFNLLKVRVRMEKELRKILEKSTSVSSSSNLNIKYFSLHKLFELYTEKYPDSKRLRQPLKLFSNVANAAIHGQTINKRQYEEARELGVKIIRDIKLTSIFDK
jgi:hypothetical protein